jgi:hypothetical protein
MHEAIASRRAGRPTGNGNKEQVAIRFSNSHFGPKFRHFGMDAEIQAKDGNKPTDLSPS